MTSSHHSPVPGEIQLRFCPLATGYWLLLMTVGGVVLCGGKSTRMGTAKATLPFGNETMLQRVVRLLETAVSPIVVVAAREQALPALPAHVAVTRDEREAKGPLEG